MIIFDDITHRRLLSRLDPRVRVACVMSFAVFICLCQRPVVLVLALGASAILLGVSGIPVDRAFKRLAGLNIIMMLLIVTMPLFMPGKTGLQIGHLVWTVEGLRRALLIAGRANAVMFILIAFLGTMEAAYLGFALNGLGFPSKFAHLLLFMVRYIEVIHHEYHHLRDAMLLRAFRPRFDGITFRALGFLVGQLLVRSINRSERIMEAMKCRGFRGRFYVLAPCRIERADIVFALSAFMAISVLGILEWM